MNLLRATAKAAYNTYCRLAILALKPMFLREARLPQFHDRNERAVEYAFAFRCIAETAPRTLLDVGTGQTAFPHLVENCGVRVTALDRGSGYWDLPLANRHFPLTKGDITAPRLERRFDMIVCVSVLEHIPNHRDALRGMFQLLQPGGHLVLTFPYNEHQYVPDVYRHPDAGYGKDYGFIAQVYSRRELEAWLADTGAEVVCQEYHEAFTGELWTVGVRLNPIRRSGRDRKHHLTCLLLRKPA